VLGVFAVLAVSAYAVHAVQVRRQVSAVKERAIRAEAQADKDPAKADEAIDLFAQYLKFRPQDGDAYRRYASLAFTQAKDDPKKVSGAIDAMEKFLRQYPENHTERRKLIDLYMKVGPLSAAK
jgi:outer membrane protein assembly factor BamD (BamD/ComL family)